MDDLEQRIAKLEEELADAKKELAGKVDKPAPPKKEEFKFSWERNPPSFAETMPLRMPAEAAAPMARLIPDLTPEQRKKLPQTPAAGLSEPGGFGSPMKPGGGSGRVERGSGWVDPAPLEPMSGTDPSKSNWSK